MKVFNNRAEVSLGACTDCARPAYLSLPVLSYLSLWFNAICFSTPLVSVVTFARSSLLV